MTGLVQDLRYGLRGLSKNLSFTFVAVAALSIGIGANTAMFSIVEAVLLRPLPFRDPSRIVAVDGIRLNPNEPRTLTNISLYDAGETNLASPIGPVRVVTAEVSENFFALFDVEPILGRTFLADEEKADHISVAILSHNLWQERFGSDRNLVGESIELNGRPVTVVGILPSDFEFVDNAKVWVPVAPHNFIELFGRNVRLADQQLARLRPGVSLEQARAELRVIAQRQSRGEPNLDESPSLLPLQEERSGSMRRALILLMGAVGLVLLMACVNIASLLLARGISRTREFAVRVATGASRFRLVQQLLTESVLLGLIGGSIGIVIAMKSTELAEKLVPALDSLEARISIDAHVLLFTLAIAVVSGVLAGLVPAFQASRLDLNSALKETGIGSGSSPSGRRLRLMNLLCVVGIAIALVLLVGAGLLLRSFGHLVDVNPGFRTDNITTAQFSLVEPAYAAPAVRLAFLESVLSRVRSLPGVSEASLVSTLPFSGRPLAAFPVKPDSGAKEHFALYLAASPGYFRTMGIPIFAGQDFTYRDRHASESSSQQSGTARDKARKLRASADDSDEVRASSDAIISQSLARLCWPAENPIGRHMTLLGKSIEVIGMVGDVRGFNLSEQPQPTLYLPLDANPDSGYVVVRSAQDPEATQTALRGVFRSVDKNEPISSVISMDQLLSQSVAAPRFRTLLLGTFASLALLLAIAGIYGVMSFSVTQRTHEIGVRMALGADQPNVLKMVLRQAMPLSLFGLMIGLVVSLGFTRVLTGFLYDTRPDDPSAFAVGVLLLMVTALVASYIPAHRAARVDPIAALRHE